MKFKKTAIALLVASSLLVSTSIALLVVSSLLVSTSVEAQAKDSTSTAWNFGYNEYGGISLGVSGTRSNYPVYGYPVYPAPYYGGHRAPYPGQVYVYPNGYYPAVRHGPGPGYRKPIYVYPDQYGVMRQHLVPPCGPCGR
jgi:hypothetical protein